jgi:hypothetical protein
MTYGSSGNQTPEVMEQNLLMQKIFNLHDNLGENRPSKPLQTPQTIVKGPQSKFGVLS